MDSMKKAFVQHIDQLDFSPPPDAWPEAMKKGARFKQFINPFTPCGDMPHEVSFSYFEIDSGVVYPVHVHDNPELYYVLKGEAKMTWGEGDFVGKPGTLVYTPTGLQHRIEVLSNETFAALVFWWAPGGDVDALGRNYQILGN